MAVIQRLAHHKHCVCVFIIYIVVIYIFVCFVLDGGVVERSNYGISCFYQNLFFFQTIPILFLDLAPTPAQLYGGKIVCDICSKTYVRMVPTLW